MVKVTVNGTCREYEDGITYETLAQEHQQEYEHRIILAVAGGKIKELHKKVDKDVTVTFQTLSDRVGHDTYVRSAVMLLIKAISDVAGSPEEGEVSVEFTIGRGLYCVPKGTDGGNGCGRSSHYQEGLSHGRGDRAFRSTGNG